MTAERAFNRLGPRNIILTPSLFFVLMRSSRFSEVHGNIPENKEIASFFEVIPSKK